MMLWAEDGRARVQVDVPDLRTVARVLGIAFAVSAWTWTAFAAGEAHMAKLQITAADDAMYCMSLLEHSVAVSERAMDATTATDARLHTLLGETEARRAWAAALLADDE